MILDIIALILIGLGLVFFAGTVMGVLRFPDFYTRCHAAGKGDTLSSLLMILGLVLYHIEDLSVDNVLVGLKILLISGFVFMTGPTTTHALIEAGYDAGIKPWTNPGQEEETGE